MNATGSSAYAEVERPEAPVPGDIARTFKRGDVTYWNCMHCGVERALGSYVLSHWNDELDHKCDCGHRHSVLRGEIRYLGA